MPYHIPYFSPGRDHTIVASFFDYAKVTFTITLLQSHGIPAIATGTKTLIHIHVPRTHAEAAKALLTKAENSPDPSGSPTICPTCAEENPSNFGSCWNCEATLPLQALPLEAEQTDGPDTPTSLPK